MTALLRKCVERSWTCLLILTLTQSLYATKISPEALTFDARLDEAVILNMEVDLEAAPTSKVDITVDGFLCDRRVTDLGGGKFWIEIAPETLEAGPVRGKIQVLSDGKPVGNSVPLSGNIRPWMIVRPSKLFLGSIGHGEKFADPKTFKVSLSSDTDPFDITSVDFREIEGASWQCEPEQGIPSNTKTLSVTFTPDALAAGLPFGALARKFIVIRTTHPNASICSIPVTGMLSVNTTGRDYSTFLYKGELRWQGPWATPNIAAAFLSMALLLLCGLGGVIHNWLGNLIAKTTVEKRNRSRGFWCFHKRTILSWVRWSSTAAVFAGFAFGSYFLAQTYSRGGWVAMATGIAILVVGTRKPRLFPLVLAGFFALSILLNPAGLSRAASTGAVGEDKSISNRLLLWQGALQMIAEHPWKGVGEGKFGEVFMRDYQLPTHTQTYSTAINDFLTLGTERGILVLALATSALITLMVFGFFRGWIWRNPFLVSCSACIASALLVSWFSSIAFQSDSTYLMTAAAGGILMSLLWKTATERDLHSAFSVPTVTRMLGRFAFTPILVGWLGGVFLIMILCVALGYFSLKSLPIVEHVTIANIDGLRVRLRSHQPIGTIVYLGDRDESPSKLVKSTLRPLAIKGWDVYCFEPSKFPSDTLYATECIIATITNQQTGVSRLNLAGHRRGATIAETLSICQSVKTTACFLTPLGINALRELTLPIKSKTDQALLLASQESDEFRSALKLRQYLIRGAKSYPAIKEILYPGEFRIESGKWQKWVEDLHAYLAVSSEE